ncbi:MAG TPA: hypothetical protein VGE35_02375 [Candidatus Paceibacterota bacterium]
MRTLITLVGLVIMFGICAFFVKMKEEQKAVPAQFVVTRIDFSNPALRQLERIEDSLVQIAFGGESVKLSAKVMELLPKLQFLFIKHLDRQILARHRVDFLAATHKGSEYLEKDSPETVAVIEAVTKELSERLTSHPYGFVCFEGIVGPADEAGVKRQWGDLRGIPADSLGGELDALADLHGGMVVALVQNKEALRQMGVLPAALELEDALSQVRSYVALMLVIERLEKNPGKAAAICYGARHAADIEKIAAWSGLKCSIIDLAGSYQYFKQLEATLPREKWF